MERKAESYIDGCIRNFQDRQNSWNDEAADVLIGIRQMYDATEDEKYFSLIETYLQHFITEDGTIEDYPANEGGMGGISCGRLLFFLYQKTGDEKYRKAIEFVMDKLRECQRCGCGNFLYADKKEPDELWLDVLYKAEPFYMEYETRYEKKEKYNDIINQFENVRKFLYNEEKGLCIQGFRLSSMARYLMALIDAMDNMSFEIYEQYRMLQDTFRLMLKGILQYQDKDTKLFPQIIEGDAAFLPEEIGSAMISYCIIKACRMGILLKEKYAACGMEIVESLTENNYLSEGAFIDSTEGVGAFLMAYGQYLQLKKEMDENG